MFWAGSYEYGTWRLRVETQGRVQLLRLTLPDRRWLNDRLAELVPPIELNGTAGWTSKPVSFASSLTVQALVQVEIESELGDVFHVHSFEEEALWQYFRKSLAAGGSDPHVQTGKRPTGNAMFDTPETETHVASTSE